jgi:hypothetical protein
VRIFHVVEVVVLDQEARLVTAANAVVVAGGREVIVEDVNLAEANARHALNHALGPPVVVQRDLHATGVFLRVVVGVADQAREAVVAILTRGPLVRGRVAELGP